MACPLGIVQQFTRYALCSPNMWMIVACTFMSLLTTVLMFYLHHGFKRDLGWLQFAQWKLQQLAERLRFQEPNVSLLERITRKVNEKNYDEGHTFEDFFRNSKETKNTNPRPGDVAANVKKAKDEDAAKILRETNIPQTPGPHASDGVNGNESILKKWTDATKDILAINDDKIDITQDAAQ